MQPLLENHMCQSRTAQQNMCVIWILENLKAKEINKGSEPHLTIMLRAPRGVTKTAGANAYAVKLATSPTITAIPHFPGQIVHEHSTLNVQNPQNRDTTP